MVDVEEVAMEAMRTGLQCSHLAADTVFSQIKALTGAVSLHAARTYDGIACRVHSAAGCDLSSWRLPLRQSAWLI